ncbi:hypothetical protein HQ576_13195 [bacterium]|nr:hypothetical protein [bacterium]
MIENVLFDADEVFVIDPGHPSGRTEVRLHLNRDPKAVQDNIRRRRKVKEAARNSARGSARTHPAPTETGP